MTLPDTDLRALVAYPELSELMVLLLLLPSPLIGLAIL